MKNCCFVDQMFLLENIMNFWQIAERNSREKMMVSMQLEIEIRYYQLFPPSKHNEW